MAVITISRQLGSGGDEIAQRVCDILGYRYFDKRLMVEVAAEVGLSEHEVVDFSEERYVVRNFLSRLFRASPKSVARVSVRHRDETGSETLTERELDAVECLALIRHSIRAAHRQGNTVIVGRGGQAILHDQPDVLHVRVIAPLPVRIKRLQQQGLTGIAEIKLKIAQQDRATAEYLKRFYDIQWDDPMCYHLMINMDKMDIELAAEMIAQAARKMEVEPVG